MTIRSHTLEGALNAMLHSKVQFAAGACALSLLVAGARGQEPTPRPVAPPAPGHGPITRQQLTPESFAGMRRLIRPDDEAYAWRKIRWHTDFWTVRQKAAAQDKPILVFWLDGAGYRDPLGLC